MKLLATAFGAAFLFSACAPMGLRTDTIGIFPIQAGELWNLQVGSSQVIEFSLTNQPTTAKDNWLYANFKSADPTLFGAGVIPDDQKYLVLVFKRSPEQFSCVLPLSANFARGVTGTGAQYQNERKVADVPCSLSRIR